MVLFLVSFGIYCLYQINVSEMRTNEGRHIAEVYSLTRGRNAGVSGLCLNL